MLAVGAAIAVLVGGIPTAAAAPETRRRITVAPPSSASSKVNAKTAPALPAPTSVVVTAGDGANTITWSVTVRTALAVYVFRSRSAGGPWALLTPKGVRGAARYVDPVPEPGTWYYIVARGVKSGIPINASTPAGNDRVSIARVLGPAGGRIEAANGALELDVPEGALVTTETITIEQVSGQRSAGVLLLAPVYACGPDPMLRAVGTFCNDRGIECQVSMETMMPCGVGVCMGCAVKLRAADGDGYRYVRACREGPVFAAEDVLWD